MTQARSLGHDNSAAIYRAITIRHSPSYLLNGSWGPGEESADSKEADSHRSVFRRSGRLRPTHGLQAVQAGVVGTVHRALWLRSG